MDGCGVNAPVLGSVSHFIKNTGVEILYKVVGDKKVSNESCWMWELQFAGQFRKSIHIQSDQVKLIFSVSISKAFGSFWSPSAQKDNLMSSSVF